MPYKQTKGRQQAGQGIIGLRKKILIAGALAIAALASISATYNSEADNERGDIPTEIHSIDGRVSNIVLMAQKMVAEAQAKEAARVAKAAYDKRIIDDAWWILEEQERQRVASLPVVAEYATVAYEAQPATYGNSGTSWDATAQCESGGNWSTNTGNGYYGGLQFDTGTWDAYGNPAYGQASDAPMEEQIAAANRMPYDGWPNC